MPPNQELVLSGIYLFAEDFTMKGTTKVFSLQLSTAQAPEVHAVIPPVAVAS